MALIFKEKDEKLIEVKMLPPDCDYFSVATIQYGSIIVATIQKNGGILRHLLNQASVDKLESYGIITKDNKVLV